MDKNKKSSLEDSLMVFHRNIVNAIKKEALKYDLTFSQVQVLFFIGPSGKATMKSIADYLKITPPSATEIVSEIERRGLVKRMSDENDRRMVYVTFTTASKKLFNSISKNKKMVFKKMIAKLNKEDKNNLERIIKILVAE